MSGTTGPAFLRWRAGGKAPEVESFATLDEALDAIEARWEELQDKAPQILDARRVLLISTDDLRRAMEEEEPAEES